MESPSRRLGSTTDRLGITLTGITPSDELPRAARLAEQSGFYAAFVREHYGEGRDSLTSLASIVLNTGQIKAGTAVTNPYARSPYLLAAAFATLDEMSRGRMLLGLGTGNPRRMDQFLGKRQERPLETIRHAVSEINQIMANGQDSLGFSPPRSHIPIYLAAVNERMLELTGEISDGVILSTITPPEYAAQAMTQVRKGLRKIGREPADFEVATVINCVVEDDYEKAEKVAKNAIVEMLARPKRGELILASIGGDEALLQTVRSELSKGNRSQALEAVPGDVAGHLAVYGDRDSCLKGIEKFRRAGVKLPILSTDLAYQRRMIEALGPNRR